MSTLNRRDLAVWIFLILILGLSFVYLRGHALIADEHPYYETAQLYAAHNFDIRLLTDASNYRTVTPPTHAILLGALSTLSGSLSVSRMRFFSFLVALFCIAVFFTIKKKLSHQPSGARTLQFAFLPFLYPFFS